VIAKKIIDRIRISRRTSTFLSAMGQPKLSSLGDMVLSDDGEGSKVGDSPLSWRTRLSTRILCQMISICGDGSFRGP